MKISNIIRKTIGNKLAALNFTYEHLNNTWFFTRVVNGFKETIQIDKSYWTENAIRITFMTESESVNSFFSLMDQRWRNSIIMRMKSHYEIYLSL